MSGTSYVDLKGHENFFQNSEALTKFIESDVGQLQVAHMHEAAALEGGELSERDVRFALCAAQSRQASGREPAVSQEGLANLVKQEVDLDDGGWSFIGGVVDWAKELIDDRTPGMAEQAYDTLKNRDAEIQRQVDNAVKPDM